MTDRKKEKTRKEKKWLVKLWRHRQPVRQKRNADLDCFAQKKQVMQLHPLNSRRRYRSSKNRRLGGEIETPPVNQDQLTVGMSFGLQKVLERIQVDVLPIATFSGASINRRVDTGLVKTLLAPD